MSVQLLPEPTLSGPKRITVGGATFRVPQAAGVVMAAGGRIAYVLSAGKVHAFCQAGEVRVPNDLRYRIARAHFGAMPR